MSVVKGLHRGFSTAAWVLLLIWLIRSFIGLGQYNLELAEGFILFVFLARITRTETRLGLTRAIASLSGKIAGFFIIAWLFLIIGGTFFGLTPVLTAYTTQALLAAILTGIVAIILNNLRRGAEVKLSNQPIIGLPQRIVSDSNITAELTSDSILNPIKLRGRTYGYIGHGEVKVTLKTGIGEIRRTIHGAFALTGVGEKGLAQVGTKRSAQNADAQNFGYKDLTTFQEKCESIYESLESQLRYSRVGVWPFVQVEDSPEGQHVRVPFVDVQQTGSGDRVSIGGFVVTDEEKGRVEVGPITIDGKHGRKGRRFGRYTILGFNSERIRIESRGHRVEMHSEEYLLTVDANSTSLRRGLYSISLSENYASFNSPSIRADVSQDGWASFRSRDTYCHISGERIRLESQGTEKTLQNHEIALKIYKKIADLVSQASAAITQNESFDETQADGLSKELRDLMATS